MTKKQIWLFETIAFFMKHPVHIFCLQTHQPPTHQTLKNVVSVSLTIFFENL